MMASVERLGYHSSFSWLVLFCALQRSEHYKILYFAQQNPVLCTRLLVYETGPLFDAFFREFTAKVKVTQLKAKKQNATVNM